MALGYDLKAQRNIILVDHVDAVYHTLYRLYRKGEIFGHSVFAAANQQRQSMANRKFIENRRSRTKYCSLCVSDGSRHSEPYLVIRHGIFQKTSAPIG